MRNKPIRRCAALMLLLALLSGLPTDAIAAERRVGGVPLPADAADGPPAEVGMSGNGRLVGSWVGSRGGTLRHVLVGGWLGTGCGSADHVNGTLAREGGGAVGPTLWLYGDDDPYYPLSHSRSNFERFRAAGGVGTFSSFPVPGVRAGHALISHRDLWRPTVETFLDGIERALP